VSTPPSPELRHKMAAARLWAAQRFPYLASVLFASPVVLRPGHGTVSADRHWRLYVDPDRAVGWPVEVLGSLFVIQANHLLREHAERAEALGVAESDIGHWNDAADAEINDDLADILRLPEGDKVVLPDDFGMQRGRLAEEYFEQVRVESRERESPDRGSGTHGRPQPGEEPAPSDGEQETPGVSSSNADLLRRQAASEIAAEHRRAGNVPAGLVRWAEARLRSKVDWRRTLAAEIRRCISDVRGQVDYSYRKPSRRSGATPQVVLPALRRPQPEVVVVCDTSASMGDERLEQVLTEVEALLRSVGVGGLAVLSVDTEVQRARRVQQASQVELVGGGGTDMGAGITAALQRRPRPDVIVVLTDGETPWPPAAPRGVRIVVGLMGRRAPAAPAWARSVRIDD
jgi:predicted metal-dependent peptidase